MSRAVKLGSLVLIQKGKLLKCVVVFLLTFGNVDLVFTEQPSESQLEFFVLQLCCLVNFLL